MKLAAVSQEHANQEFYDNVIELLEEEKELSKESMIFYDSCKDSVVKFKNPKKLLEKSIEQLVQQSPEKQVESVYKIASTLEK